MRTLSATLLAAQKAPMKPLCKLVLTKTGVPTITYTTSRIIDLLRIEDGLLASAQVLLDNSDKALNDLDLRGYTGTISRGFTTKVTETLRPNGDGDETNISNPDPGRDTHYDLVDEASPDDDTTMVYEDTSTTRDLYALPASSGSGVISKIRVHFRCKGQHLANKFQASIKSNSTVTDGAIKRPAVVDTWENFSQEWAKNPADNQPWEWADIDALQIGVQLTAILGYLVASCTQVYVEVYSVEDEYSAIQPMKVIPQQDYSAPGLLSGYLTLSGYFNLMREDKANDSYVGDPVSSDTVKTIFTAVAGATLSVFDHCTAYTVIYDSEDSLIDTFQPKETFTVSRNESRFNVLTKLISWTECVMLMKADGNIHVLVPTIS